jgi:hypothetical protein
MYIFESAPLVSCVIAKALISMFLGNSHDINNQKAPVEI